jgi:hypothetical protein
LRGVGAVGEEACDFVFAHLEFAAAGDGVGDGKVVEGAFMRDFFSLLFIKFYF